MMNKLVKITAAIFCTLFAVLSASCSAPRDEVAEIENKVPSRARWHNNQGIRIDHFLLSPAVADKLEACEVHKDPRGWDKPSDHTPIMITLAA